MLKMKEEVWCVLSFLYHCSTEQWQRTQTWDYRGEVPKALPLPNKALSALCTQGSESITQLEKGACLMQISLKSTASFAPRSIFGYFYEEMKCFPNRRYVHTPQLSSDSYLNYSWNPESPLKIFVTELTYLSFSLHPNPQIILQKLQVGQSTQHKCSYPMDS